MSEKQAPSEEHKRRKRELIIILAILPLVGLLTFVETRLFNFGADFPFSNSILIFIIINLNLILLLLLIFLVFRNLVKLYYDRKAGLPGARLRTRLLIAFITLTLLPTTVLFVFSVNFISTSIAFWFNVPVEQALENALAVGRHVYTQTSENNHFFIQQLSEDIDTRKLLLPDNREELREYLEKNMDSLPVNGIDVYGPGARLVVSLRNSEEKIDIPPLDSEELFRKRTGAPLWERTEITADGEIVHSSAPIYSESDGHGLLGYIVLHKHIPAFFLQHLEIIGKGREEYQQIELLKQPVQRVYYIALSIVALLVLFCAIWFAFYLARHITTPIMELAKATQRIAEGDLQFQIASTGDDEIGLLVQSFNKMTRDLFLGQQEISRSSKLLREQNFELEGRRRYIETILKNVSAGVISLDSDGIIVTVNPSAEKMLGIKAEQIIRKPYKEVLPKVYLKSAVEVEKKIRKSGSDIEMPMVITVGGNLRNFLTHFSALLDDEGKQMGLVMVFDDVTELEKGQRVAAWREVARRIAHEVKNPLTPLSLSAQRLRRKYKSMLKDPIFDECTRTIMDHVEVIRNLVNEFANYARFPAARMNLEDLAPIVADSVAFFRRAHPGILFFVHMEPKLPRIFLDAQQSRQLVLNILGNAATAMKDKGSIHVTLFKPEGLSVLRLEIKDTGPGIAPEEKIRIFEPYYSGSRDGTGLGLSIVNSIVADHGAGIEVLDNQPAGACFRIDYPLPSFG